MTLEKKLRATKKQEGEAKTQLETTSPTEEARKKLIEEIEVIEKEIEAIKTKIAELKKGDEQNQGKTPISGPEIESSEQTDQTSTEDKERKTEYSFEEIFEEIKKDILTKDGVKKIDKLDIEYSNNQIIIRGIITMNLFVNRMYYDYSMNIKSIILENKEGGLSVVDKNIMTGRDDALRQNEKVQAVLNILENLDKEIVKHAKEKEVEKININGKDLKFL